MSEITVKVKMDWCKWAIDYKVKNAYQKLAAFPEALAAEVSKWDENTVWWGDGGLSERAGDVMNGKIGTIKFHRLLFGDTAKHLNDEELFEMLQKKEKDPASDYMVIAKRLKATSDPKAGGLASSASQGDETTTSA